MKTQADAGNQTGPAPDVTALWLDERRFVPNNPRLPVLIYAAAFAPGSGNLATAIENRFAENGWPPQWRNGIYDFHHYHSEGHEVLGVARGQVRLILGGEGGREIDVAAGDALLLPAGTGHCRVAASDDLLVVGAYPPGQTGDIRRGAATPAQRLQMVRLSFPPSDPIWGADGPLARHWTDGVAGSRARLAPDQAGR